MRSKLANRLMLPVALLYPPSVWVAFFDGSSEFSDIRKGMGFHAGDILHSTFLAVDDKGIEPAA